MTRQKSFKARVRGRMHKTGESYTTARRQLLSKSATTAEGEADTVRALQHSDDVVRERTGRGWDEWFALLDDWQATERTHTDIAGWLSQENQVPGWWAQSITVTYEQARGMRAPGQRSDGTFSASASKTISVPVEQLFKAFVDDGVRGRWLPGAVLVVRSAAEPKALRAEWVADSTRVVAGFTAKGEGRAQVGLAHEKLPDADAAARMKGYWRARLTELKQLLER